MAYSTDNSPALVVNNLSDGGRGTWFYKTADAIADINTDGYITNAKKLGMKVDDEVTILSTSTTPDTQYKSIVIAINANGSADLSDGVAVSGADAD